MNNRLPPAAYTGPTVASLAKMPPEQREHLTVNYFQQLFEHDAKAALRAYDLLIGTTALPNLYLHFAQTDAEHAQVAFAAVQKKPDAPYSRVIASSITEQFGLERNGTHKVMEMLHRVKTGAHKDVPTILDAGRPDRPHRDRLALEAQQAALNKGSPKR